MIGNGTVKGSRSEWKWFAVTYPERLPDSKQSRASFLMEMELLELSHVIKGSICLDWAHTKTHGKDSRHLGDRGFETRGLNSQE